MNDVPIHSVPTSPGAMRGMHLKNEVLARKNLEYWPNMAPQNSDKIYREFLKQPTCFTFQLLICSPHKVAYTMIGKTYGKNHFGVWKLRLPVKLAPKI